MLSTAASKSKNKVEGTGEEGKKKQKNRKPLGNFDTITGSGRYCRCLMNS
jgi:hypothetical protein